MARTLKDMLNDVLAQSGFLEKTSFALSSDPDDKQMVAIANRVALEISQFYDWGSLRKSTEINLITGTSRYQLPNDFKSFVPDSAWETDGSRPVELPTPDGRWYLFKFSAFSDGGTLRAKFYGNELEIHDAVTGESFKIEYISNSPIKDISGAVKERFTADTDTFILDDQLLVLGIQAHWMQTKLMPQYKEHLNNYMIKMNEAIARSAGGRTIGGTPANPSRSPYTKLWV